jgi:signal transduction histidine kinase
MSRLSLRVRMTLLTILSFAAGALVFTVGRTFIVSWALSTFAGAAQCPWGGNSCAPWPANERVMGGAVIVGGLVCLLWFAWASSRGLNRPLANMVDIVRRLGPQNLGQRVHYRGSRDEVRALANALDEMLDRMAAGYEGQRRFASNASHELRTPLAVQRTLVEVAVVTGEQDLSRLAAQLLAVNERNERLIEGLLVLAESDRGLPGTEPVRLDLLAGEVLDRFAEQAAEHGVTLTRFLVERTVNGDPVLLERLVTNLVHNAITYNEPGGTVEVMVSDQPALTVQNTGQRVPPEAVPALFEPFRRLTAERVNHHGGAGLGLSIVRSIAAAHHGTVSASPGDHGGLRVMVQL